MAISNHATDEEQAAETERVWEEFWLPIVSRPDGSIDMEQVKREMHDLHMLFEKLTKAFGWMTSDRVTNVNTDWDVVKAMAEDRRTKEIDEAVAEAVEIEPEEAGD